MNEKKKLGLGNFIFNFFLDYPNRVQLGATSSLNEFQTEVGYSFRCDLYQELKVVNTSEKELSIKFVSNTQWEAFGMNKSGCFHGGELH